MWCWDGWAVECVRAGGRGIDEKSWRRRVTCMHVLGGSLGGWWGGEVSEGEGSPACELSAMTLPTGLHTLVY